MKRLSLVCAAALLFATGGTGYAAQGSYDGYGYQMPRRGAAIAPAITGKASKPSKAAAAGQVKKKQNGAGSLTGMKPSLGGGGPAKVNLATGYGAGKIIIDQSAKKLYYTVSSTQAYVYPVAVGKKGFKWTGTKKITKEVNWPDWRPPAEMRQRKPNLPGYMPGGVKNPLGAKALYLGNSLYRIHGTNDPSSIGTDASSGCIRMHNGDVLHLAKMAGVGTTVHVVNKLPRSVASN